MSIAYTLYSLDGKCCRGLAIDHQTIDSKAIDIIGSKANTGQH